MAEELYQNHNNLKTKQCLFSLIVTLVVKKFSLSFISNFIIISWMMIFNNEAESIHLCRRFTFLQRCPGHYDTSPSHNTKHTSRPPSKSRLCPSIPKYIILPDCIQIEVVSNNNRGGDKRWCWDFEVATYPYWTRKMQ